MLTVPTLTSASVGDDEGEGSGPPAVAPGAGASQSVGMTTPTRPGFLGSDVVAQQRLEAVLTGAAGSFATIRTQLTRQLADLDWRGPDGTSFRQQWTGAYAPFLQRIGEAMTTAAGDIARQRGQQETASSAGAVAGTPTGTAPGAVSAGEDPAAATSPGAEPTGADPTGTGRQPSGAQQPVALQVPFYGQFVAGHGYTPGNTACFKASKAMAAQLGAEVLGPDQRIQVASGENKDGSVVLDAGRAQEGRTYIDDQLDSGRPVVVGVSHKSAYNGNVDRITDHFVVITGRGTDESGQTYYTFNDPATSYADKGSDSNPANRFRLTEGGVMVSDGTVGTGKIVDRHIEVSMVRRNR